MHRQLHSMINHTSYPSSQPDVDFVTTGTNRALQVMPSCHPGWEIKNNMENMEKTENMRKIEKGRSPQICTVSYSVTSKNALLIPWSWTKIIEIVIGWWQNINKKHAMPPPRLSCPKVGKPEKNGMSHCTALLKKYRLGLLKDKKEMNFVQNSCA